MVTVDAARDAAYTRDLGRAIAKAYVKETVVMATQLVAHVLFRRLCRATPGLDLFARLRHRGDIAVPMDELVADVALTRDGLRKLELEGRVHLNAAIRKAEPDQIVSRALDAWSGYHQKPIARVLGGSVIAEDPNLLLFYQNRLRLFAPEIAGPHPGDQQAALEIAAMEGDR